MKYTTRAFLSSLLLACVGTSAGCNGILGIEAPEDTVLLDAGTPPDDSSPTWTRDAGANDGDGGGDVSPPTIQSDGGAQPVVPNDGRWATWPMPNPASTGLDHPQNYAISPDGFVTDEVTGLEWQQTVDGEPLSWQDANAHCAELDLGGDGFRIPTRIELLSLVDFTASNPSIDGETFPDTPSAFFWSSSRFAIDHSSVWVLNFGAAPAFLSSSDLSSRFHVRCVRVAADAPRRQFTAKNGTVSDSATRLVWQREAPEAVHAFDDAAEYCGGLDLDGDGWRLPTIKELQTLVDEGRSMPSIDPKAFPNTAPDIFYWTASAVAGVADAAWGVNFRFGFDGASETNMKQHVRCVR